jgi:hypothetical protein
MSSWFQRRSAPSRAVVLSSGFRYNGPTSDSVSSSTSLTAAAARVSSEKVKRSSDPKATNEGWQEEAWAMYDQVGELRYVSNAIASRMGQAELYVEKNGKRLDDEDPVLALITAQMIERMGLNLFVGGTAYLVGLPVKDKATETLIDGIPAEGVNPDTGEQSVWMVLSSMEVKRSGKGKNAKVEIRGTKYVESDIYIERIWDPHPAIWEAADSPVRSALPVLRELVGLTQHVSAQIDSRLAGAGVYWIPNSILSSAKTPDTGKGEQSFSDNPVLNAIMASMILPMEDRSNASSIVPLLLGAPDEAISKIRFDSFATEFDKNTKNLREEAIRRLGLNLDAPPELLMGMGDANHWGMWLVRDEVIQAHVKPRLDLITDALTTGFYRPVMEQQGDPDPDSYVVKADVSSLVQRPNRLADASQLHSVNAIGDKALRAAGGFDETDAPSSDERAIALALQVASGNPQLLDNMPEIVAAVKAILDGTPETGKDQVSSKRVPGTLKPLVPANAKQIETAPNGTPVSGKGATPIVEADGQPAAGSPVG